MILENPGHGEMMNKIISPDYTDVHSGNKSCVNQRTSVENKNFE
jgi:hypothetical protein